MSLDDKKNQIIQEIKKIKAYEKEDYTSSDFEQHLEQTQINHFAEIKNILIEIHPSLRIPRTFRRFCGLMIELLQRNKIRASHTNDILMKVISNPIEKYLPPGGLKVGMSVAGKQVGQSRRAGDPGNRRQRRHKRDSGPP